MQSPKVTYAADSVHHRRVDARKVLTLEQVKTALGTPVKMTALRQLDYHSSYSHGGRYYTLERMARVEHRQHEVQAQAAPA